MILSSPHLGRPRGGLRSLLLAAVLVVPAAAQNPRLQIQSVEKLSAQALEVADVTLEGPILKMAARFLGNDPEARQLIQGLKGVFVKSFKFDKAGVYSPADVEAIRSQLQGPGWARIVGVQGKGDKGSVEVYVMPDAGGNPQGLAVLAMEPKALTVVNIVGEIDLERLGALEGKLGIPKLHGAHGARTSGGVHEAKP
jgi:hypothetical protein